jgi:arylsulfatase A-like enzyme
MNAQIAVAARLAAFGLALASAPTQAQQVLPVPPPPFKGEIGLSAKDSKPDFPKPVQAPRGAPNVLLVLLDDVGFGATSTFGGPVATPTLERLARDGLRYNQFHTTAVCSPTRAALLTGRNHHTAHSGVVTEGATGYPGYDSLIQRDTATVAEVLRQRGWNTAWFGKNHNIPDWQTSQAGPFDLWPTGMGFEHFYGFIGGDTNQWRPGVFEGTKPIEPYLGKPDYNLDYDLSDQAVGWIRMQKAVAPDRPFFVYYAPGATHAPHHPRREWIEKYRGKFDQGWDRVREESLARQLQLGVVPPGTRLTPRPGVIQAWSSLGGDQRKLFARMMEVYAGYLEQTDHNVGRVIDAIREAGQLDNTLVVYIAGDNGASAEGGAQGLLNEVTWMNGMPEDLAKLLARMDDLGTWKTYNHYPVGWAHAMDTPFQWTKQIASHYGGTRNGMVISWPARIQDRGGLRSQWHHVVDVVPTILEAAGVTMPDSVNGVTQKPLEGVSMAYSFSDAKAPSTHRTQYFEMIGHRAIYRDGWIAATTPPATVLPWTPPGPVPDVVNGYRWELYDTSKDFSEADDLAAKEPERLRSLQQLFLVEAARFNVFPLDNSKMERFDTSIRPSLTRGRTSFTYAGGMSRIPEGAAPDVKNKSFTITAQVEIVKAPAEGVIVTQGGLFGGWALYVENGKPVFFYNTANLFHASVASPAALGPGKHVVVLAFRYDGGVGKGGLATLKVDGEKVAEGRVERTIPYRFSLDEGLDVGEDSGTPVNLTYDVPFRFTGRVEKVTIDLGEVAKADREAVEAAEKLARTRTGARD